MENALLHKPFLQTRLPSPRNFTKISLEITPRTRKTRGNFVSARLNRRSGWDLAEAAHTEDTEATEGAVGQPRDSRLRKQQQESLLGGLRCPWSMNDSCEVGRAQGRREGAGGRSPPGLDRLQRHRGKAGFKEAPRAASPRGCSPSRCSRAGGRVVTLQHRNRRIRLNKGNDYMRRREGTGERPQERKPWEEAGVSF